MSNCAWENTNSKHGAIYCKYKNLKNPLSNISIKCHTTLKCIWYVNAVCKYLSHEFALNHKHLSYFVHNPQTETDISVPSSEQKTPTK